MSDRQHLRAIPSVDAMLRELGPVDVPRAVVVRIVRRSLAALRTDGAPPPDAAAIMAAVRGEIDSLRQGRLRPLINATGIVIHTNLGRAPLAPSAVDAMTSVGANYNNLEYDLAAGTRGSRAAYLEQSLATLCEAEAATVVNNCAAALVLMLRHFATRPPRDHVLISRGELVQIGGGFRVPDILVASGATIREVGTTNRTTADDYRDAIDERTALLLRVHRSNFYMEGFIESPSTADLAAIAREAGVPFVDDLGSGATFDTSTIGDGERALTPAMSLRDGATLVCFSGDKLLGGPQAGIIAGDARDIAALKKDPLFRALRCDKLVLAGLQATVDLLLDGQSDAIPIRAMLNHSIDVLRRRAEQIQAALPRDLLRVTIGRGDSEPGGGALPKMRIPSVTLEISLHGIGPQQIADALRVLDTPIIGYVAADRFRLDLRTVFERQDVELVDGLRWVAKRFTSGTAR